MEEIQTAVPIDILLFGETGCGKSTTVNAIANYCRFETFEDAERGEFSSPIPAPLELRNPATGKLDPIDKELVLQEERNHTIGQSVTQEAKSYEFRFRGRRIRLIDTPGMGDTNGVDADKRNFDKIVYCVKSNFKSLNAVCFLIKSLTSRKTAVFQHTLQQLLLNFDQRACENIIFLFTYSRNSLYGVGDGFNTVKAFLREGPISGQKIQMKVGVNCFFIDNEAFQFLLAHKRGYRFSADVREGYKESWNVSVKNITRMLDSIERNLHPLNVSIHLLSMYYGIHRHSKQKDEAQKNVEGGRSYRRKEKSRKIALNPDQMFYAPKKESPVRRRSSINLEAEIAPIPNQVRNNQRKSKRNKLCSIQ